ncbi:PaaI family thioesterase [Sphingomonas sp.]|uniref:PaaI family thioesterase n=1 Tax=Sphingomonas sp. TaxID=28214 RepID=UPI003AFF8BB1
MIALTLPPYALWLGVSVEERPDGPLFRLDFAPDIVGRPGFVHGGALGGLLEIAAVGTLRHALAAEEQAPVAKPVSVGFDFMRGARERETWAAARIVRLGARIATVEARAWQDDPDRPVATARMTLLLDREPPDGPA